MTGAFAAATATLYRDRNMATAAAIVRGGQRQDCRVVIRDGDQRIDLLEQGIVADNLLADAPRSQLILFDPAAGDTLEVGGHRYEVVGTPTLEAQRLIWTMELRRLAAAEDGQ